jgi:NADH pyrophosphatase NudC (nudix superfamily)
MSMTLEEAIELLCYGDWLKVISEHIGKQDTERIAKAMSIVGKALRPVSREQVEMVWRGEWKIVEHEFFTCTRCVDSYYNGAESTEQAESYLNSRNVYDFCPHCGSANTDKAVQMVMERLEALKDE